MFPTLHFVALFVGYRISILDFKLSLCSECCILSFGWFPGVWILCADISEHTVCSIFIGGVSRNLPTYIAYDDGTQCFLQHQHLKFRCQGITQKKEYKKAFLSPKTSLLNLLRLLNVQSQTENETNKSIIPKVCKAISFS